METLNIDELLDIINDKIKMQKYMIKLYERVNNRVIVIMFVCAINGL